MAKGYWIANITVTNPDAYREYVERDTPIVERYGGRFIVRGGEVGATEGDVLDRHVVIEFADYDSALACYNSPEYREVAEIRRANAQSRLVVVAGA